MGFFDRFKKKSKAESQKNVKNSISSVQKNHSNNLDENIRSSQELNNSVEDNNLSNLYDESDFKKLNELINGGNKNLSLDSDFFLKSKSETIKIDFDDIVIDGNNHIIDGGKEAQIFEITGNNVILKNIHFKNGKRAIANSGNCKIINCVFEDNYYINFQGLSSGGAIFNYIEGVCKLEYCTFKNNGKLGYKSQGGAINNGQNCQLYVKNSIFESNQSDRGGAIFSEGFLKILNSEFKNNYSLDGSVLYNHSFRERYLATTDIENCKFNGNKVEFGGIIVNISSYITISKSIFSEDNIVKSNSISKDYLIVNKDGEIHIHGCEFKNTEYSETKFIYQEGDENAKLSFEESVVSFKNGGNLTLIGGFAYISNTKFILVDYNFDEHLVFNENAILKVSNLKFHDFTHKTDLTYSEIIDNKNVLEIADNKKEDSVEDTNYSEDYKGFLYLDDLIHGGSKEITLHHDILINDLEKDFYEGGIELDIDNLIIDGQNHIIDARNLSRIFIIVGKDIILKNIKFLNGKYFRNFFDDLDGGGALYCQNNSSLVIENCEFIGNVSLNTSGAIYNNGNVEIFNSKFLNNESLNVNDILNNNGTLNFENCEFKKNKRLIKINKMMHNCHFINKNILTFKNCNFKFSESKYTSRNIKNYATLELINCDFTKSEGDFADVENFNILKINNSSFSNTSRYKPIINKESAILYLNYSEFHKLNDNIDNYVSNFDNENGFIKILYDVIPTNTESWDYLEYLISISNEIYLENDFLFKPNERVICNPIILKDNVIIDGQGHEIDGANCANIFEVIGDNVIIKNIRFKNSNDFIINKGVLNVLECYFENKGNLFNWNYMNMENCSLNNCVISNNGNFNLSNSSFENTPIRNNQIFNSENNIFNNSTEFAISNYGDDSGECILKECIFEDNLKPDVLNQKGKAYLIQCNFINNIERDIGSIKNSSFIEIKNSNFKSNIQNRTGNTILNSRIHSKAIIKNCNFDGKNKYALCNNGEMNIESCKFKRNHKIFQNNTGIIRVNEKDKNLIKKANGGEFEII